MKKSTFSRLMRSLVVALALGASVAKADYIDYQNDTFEEGNLLSPFVYKRKSYEHEREVRVVHWRSDETQLGQKEPKATPPGVLKAVNLNQLISNVFVSPDSAAWFASLVESVMRRYGINAPVKQSDLKATPIF